MNGKTVTLSHAPSSENLSVVTRLRPLTLMGKTVARLRASLCEFVTFTPTSAAAAETLRSWGHAAANKVKNLHALAGHAALGCTIAQTILSRRHRAIHLRQNLSRRTRYQCGRCAFRRRGFGRGEPGDRTERARCNPCKASSCQHDYLPSLGSNFHSNPSTIRTSRTAPSPSAFSASR